MFVWCFRNIKMNGQNHQENLKKDEDDFKKHQEVLDENSRRISRIDKWLIMSRFDNR